MAERRDGVQVLSRAAQMLRRLAAESDGLTSIELADRVGLPRSTAYR
ncbi:MAG: helix-turn-helix domain-containing protein, partial [Actinobacteria bacterium]|nr:helix-turn-helix domain-containing protein [Actinomycetota bacterium]